MNTLDINAVADALRAFVPNNVKEIHISQPGNRPIISYTMQPSVDAININFTLDLKESND